MLKLGLGRTLLDRDRSPGYMRFAFWLLLAKRQLPKAFEKLGYLEDLEATWAEEYMYVCWWSRVGKLIV